MLPSSLLTLTDAYPSSTAFDTISDSLCNDEGGRKDAIKQGKAIFAFTLKNKAGETASWHIDLKTNGTVGKGEAPEGQKANVTLNLSDEDFGKLISGKSKAQNLFMQVSEMDVGGGNLEREWGSFWLTRTTGEVKGQGRCDEGDEDGADIGQGENKCETIDGEWVAWMQMTEVFVLIITTIIAVNTLCHYLFLEYLSSVSLAVGLLCSLTVISTTLSELARVLLYYSARLEQMSTNIIYCDVSRHDNIAQSRVPSIFDILKILVWLIDPVV